MKPIERIGLVDRISRELQSRMSFADIVSYLKQYKIKTKSFQDYRSKYIYSKELLDEVHDQVLIDIAKELKIEEQYLLVDVSYSEGELKFWKPGYFKLFVSHLSSFKETVTALKNALENYGISSFVAHEDIEPAKEWMTEIEKALFSMDAMIAILMNDFHKSNWTDQEIGIAIGKGKLVIPIIKGVDPYGFIGKYQGLKGNGKTVNEVATGIFKILCNNEKTFYQMQKVITELFLVSISKDEAIKWLKLIENMDNFSKEFAEKLAERISDNLILLNNSEILRRTNSILNRFGIERVSKSKSFSIKDIINAPLEDLPF
jgi:hypothetical protein